MENDKRYRSAEAFRLMPYQCPDCGHLELIWNSRDAVTPFSVLCHIEGCQGMARHVFPHESGEPEQIHFALPDEADRVFSSITPAQAVAIAEKRIASYPGEDPETYIETDPGFVGDLARQIYGDGNQPKCITRHEYELEQQAREIALPGHEPEDFARMFRIPGVGQVVALVDYNPRSNDQDAAVHFHFDPGVPGLGISELSFGFQDGEAEPATEKADKLLHTITEQRLGPILRETIARIRAAALDDDTAQEEGSDNA